jgi:alpha-N-arabinofuranosidase
MNILTIHLDDPIGTIRPEVYGHFAEHLGRCIDEGIWVGEASSIPNIDGIRQETVEALRRIAAPVIRWPGGCFADDYHWEDGIGPREKRPRRVNLWWHQEESNTFGTDEFIRLCRLVGAEPYICTNVGSGSPQEARNWLEYCNYEGDTHYSRLRGTKGYKVRYWGVGNENWGCGGQFDPVDYAKEYRRFANYLRQLDQSIQLIACGHTTPDWNLKFMETMGHLGLIDHLSIHRYFGCGNDVEFTDQEYYTLIARSLQVDDDIRKTDEVLSFFAGGRKEIGIIVDEWGVWHPQARGNQGLEQKNTLRDAIVAAGVLDVFNRWAARVTMGNLAQTINVLQCIAQTAGETFWVTPTYHVFRMYREHMGNASLRVDVDCGTMEVPLDPGKNVEIGIISASASLNREQKRLIVSVVNRHLTEAVECTIRVKGDGALQGGKVEVLTADDVRMSNGPDAQNGVAPKEEVIGVQGDSFTCILLPHSIHVFLLRVM